MGMRTLRIALAVIAALLLPAACGIKAPPRPPDALHLILHPPSCITDR